MLYNLLDAGSTDTNQGSMLPFILICLAFVLMLVVTNYLTNKKRKKMMEEEQARRQNMKAGFSVITIGGIKGEVVSVSLEENQFVLKTGTEEHTTYLTLDMQAIYQLTDPSQASEQTATVENETETADETAEEQK